MSATPLKNQRLAKIIANSTSRIFCVKCKAVENDTGWIVAPQKRKKISKRRMV